MASESLELSFPAWFRWLRKWRRLHALGFSVLFAATVVYAILAVPVRSATFLVGEFAALAFWAIPAGQLWLIECPRCQRRFFWWLGLFTFVIIQFQSRCSHCGLPEYADHIDTSAKT
jgi:hypothetical protein